jgi:DNA-binding transcriptional ArsR family regulator
MTDEAPGRPPQPRALAEAMKHPLRSRVHAALSERPGVTVNELSRRLDVPPRRIRHQIEWLVEADLVRVDSTTRRRNTRELGYRALHKPLLTEEDEAAMSQDDWRRLALSVLGLLVDDMRRAIDAKTLAKHPGHALVRVPGTVDQAGWDELARLAARTLKELEKTMEASARRVEAGSAATIDVTAAFLLFEGPPWQSDGDPD